MRNLDISGSSRVSSGRRIFLIGNGPSLAWTPLDLLIGEESWGMARVHLIYGSTQWRPTRYWWSDHPQNAQDMADVLWHMEQGYPCWYRSDVCQIITGEYKPAGGWAPEPRELPQHVHPWRYCIEHNAGLIRDPRTGGVDLRRPAGWHLGDGVLCKYGSGLNPMLQQAYLEGYSPIYLVGVDLGFQESTLEHDPNHFTAAYHSRAVEPERAAVDNDTHVDFHGHAREWCAPRGVHIYNATLGGSLEVFPRVDLLEVLGGRKEPLDR